jgi:hypothetical protein
MWKVKYLSLLRLAALVTNVECQDLSSRAEIVPVSALHLNLARNKKKFRAASTIIMQKIATVA